MSISGPDDTPPPSELQGLDPKDLLQAGLETVPPVTLPPQPVDGEVTMRVAGPSQPSAPQMELPSPEDLTQLLPAGAYQVEGFLGQGGMGAVYKGQQIRLKRPVAIKIMRRDMGKDYDFEARFEREAQAMAKLNHPNIVSVIDFGEAGADYLYIVMELIDGADLMDVIRGGQMTQEMALTLLPQVCDALQFAHDHGIVHRDIKPSNIMLTRDGRVKMCDFGLAKRYDVESSFRTQTGTGMGTPDYAAPEQFDPSAHIDHRADIYALGVMIYQMITGQLPRGVWKPPSQRAEVAPQWDDIVSRAMQSDPADRYQQASEVKTDVSSIPLAESRRSRQTADAADPKAPQPRALASTPTKSRAALAIGTVVIGIVAFVGVFFALKKPEESGRGRQTAEEATSTSDTATPPRALASAPTPASAPALPESGWKPLFTEAEWRTSKGSEREFKDGVVHLRGAGWRKAQPSPDGAIRAKVQYHGQSSPCLEVRNTGDGGRYKLDTLSDGKTILLLYFAPGDAKSDATLGTHVLPKALVPGQTLQMELRVQGSLLTAFINGNNVIEVQDTRITKAGEWGIFAQEGWFESVEVQSLAAQASTTEEAWVDMLSDPKQLRLGDSPDAKFTSQGLQMAGKGSIFFGQLTDRDGAVRIRTRLSDEGTGFTIRGRMYDANDVGSGYYALAVVNENEARLTPVRSATDAKLNPQIFKISPPLRRDQDYEMELRVVGNRLTAKLDGRVLGELNDSTIKSGRFGIATSSSNPPLVRSLQYLNLDKPAPAQAPINLLASVDVKRDAVKGQWELNPEGLVAKKGKEQVLSLHRTPPEEYDFEIEFTLSSGKEVSQVLPLPGGSIVSKMGFGKVEAPTQFFGFGPFFNRQNLNWSARTEGVSQQPRFKLNQRYRSLVQVRKNSLRALLDGVEVAQWSGDLTRFTGDPGFALPDPTHLGLGSFESDIVFHKIELRPVSASGTKPDASSSSNVPISSSSTKFPPGQWVKLFTKPEDLPADLRKPDSGVKWEDGWISPRDPAKLIGTHLPDEIKGNFGIRIQALRGTTRVILGEGIVLRSQFGGHYQCKMDMEGLRISRRDKTKYTTLWSDQSTPPPQGQTYNVEFAAIGDRLMGRSGGTVKVVTDSQWKTGHGYVNFSDKVRDIEVINLDGLPEAEALRLLGVDEQGNDLLGKAASVSTSPNLPVTKPSVATATKDAPFINTLGMKFVPVPISGGPTDKQRVLFSVWETRVQDYEAFVKETNREWPKPGFEQGPTHPAVMVSWDDAQAFCQWLTERERKAGKLGERERYRLPSDHEWSCAVGIGVQEDATKLPSDKASKIWEVFPWGRGKPPPVGAGNFAGEERKSAAPDEENTASEGRVIPDYKDAYVNTAPVGSFVASNLGLHDLSGNVWEWCADWIDATQKQRVLRGGHYESTLNSLISTKRDFILPTRQLKGNGFRIVLEVSTKGETAASQSPSDGAWGQSALPSAATKDLPFVNTLGMKFVPVPITGGPAKGQRVLFSVWETRVQDYAAYAAANPKADGSWKTQAMGGVPVGREPEHPVAGVNWGDAQAFCQWLTAKETAEGKLPQGMKYRLPSDEEWSWAAGLPAEMGATPAEKSEKNRVDFPWGKDWPPSKNTGNYADESFHAKFPQHKENDQPWIKGYTDGYATTSPVGSFPANAYGLYDMGGNVWQWCEDWFDTDQKKRVLRGASWDINVRDHLLLSHRRQGPPGSRDNYMGFRIVLAPESVQGTGGAAKLNPPSDSGNTPANKPGSLGQSVLPSAATKDKPFINTLGMKFVPVPITGGPTDKQRVLFSIWETRVQDYEAFVKETGIKWPKADFEQGPTHPAVMVSWEDAKAFCLWLTERERKAGKLGAGEVYRLASDREWSCAVGIGDHEKVEGTPASKSGVVGAQFPWGKEWPPPPKAGNYADSTFHQAFPADKSWIEGYTDGFAATAPVGSFAANSLGLFDLGGNVSEWCEDWFEALRKNRTTRGNNYDDGYDKWGLSSSFRYQRPEGYRDSKVGFRCVLAVAVEKAAAWQPAYEPVASLVAKKATRKQEGEWLVLPGSDSIGDTKVKYEKGIIRLKAQLASEGGTLKVGSSFGEIEIDHTSKDTSLNLWKLGPLPNPPRIKHTEPLPKDRVVELMCARVGSRAFAWLDGKLIGTRSAEGEHNAGSPFVAFEGKEHVTKLTAIEVMVLDDVPESQWPEFLRAAMKAAAPSPPPAAPATPAKATPATATKEAPFINTLGMKFVPVPIMGGTTNGQRVLFSVWETRVQDYTAYAAANPKADGAWKTQQKDGVPVGREPDHPVVGVSWDDAQAFCQWLTAKDTAEGKLPPGMKYRLPSDEEWSWAAGMPPELGATPAEKNENNDVDFPWGKEWPLTKKVGNYADESFHTKFPLPDAMEPERIRNEWIKDYNDGFATTSPVGSFPANPYGICDMGGNVWQWCEDWWNADQKERVVRGAGWGSYGRSNLLSSSRNHRTPTTRSHPLGFRVVLAPQP